MDKRFWAIVGVIVVVFGGILLFHGNGKDSANNKSSSANASNHVRGNTSSKVTLLEYGDFECPVCEGYYPTMQQVEQKYGDTIKFQFRNLPLLQIHPNAFAGARAAEAAGKQGKFWEMYDQLYNSANWNEWSTSSNPVPYFKNYSKAVGLNETQFEKDFSSSVVNNSVNADIAAFKKTGQQEATPTFFINGKYYPNSSFVDANGNPSVDAFGKLLDAALKSAK